MAAALESFGKAHAEAIAFAEQVEGHVEHLATMHMTLELLRETAVGRVVKRISRRREPALATAAAKARELVVQWQQVADAASSKPRAPATAAPAARVAAVQAARSGELDRAAEAAARADARASFGSAELGRAAQGTKKRTAPADTAGEAAGLLGRLASTGNPVRDKAVAILAHALTPADALSPAEAALALEASLFAAYGSGGDSSHGVNGGEAPGAERHGGALANGGGTGGGVEASGDRAQGGGASCSAVYKRRVRLLWGLLAPDSGACLPELRARLLRGEVASEALATVKAEHRIAGRPAL
ncbi:hypothetical protein WJX81_003587 [Elliptochloris bilobata]|uniref:TFIIS N-terminal domain-containing protein n=1 Tax=Elliptochloris bilobata TaxID=381761 RepID=A0AAW1RFX6_9CHLO